MNDSISRMTPKTLREWIYAVITLTVIVGSFLYPVALDVSSKAFQAGGYDRDIRESIKRSEQIPGIVEDIKALKRNYAQTSLRLDEIRKTNVERWNEMTQRLSRIEAILEDIARK